MEKDSKKLGEGSFEFEAGSTPTEGKGGSNWQSPEQYYPEELKKKESEIRKRDRTISQLSKALSTLQTPERVITDIGWIKKIGASFIGIIIALIAGFFWFIYGPYERNILSQVDNKIMRENQEMQKQIQIESQRAEPQKTNIQSDVNEKQSP